MSLLRLAVSTIAIIASCEASGLGHLVPAVKSLSVVRYAPFYNFPNGIRSIHAVAPVVRALPVAPAPLLPAPIPPPAPIFAGPAPVFSAPVPVPPAPTPVFSAPAPLFPAPTQVFSAPAPLYPAPAPLLPSPYLRSSVFSAPVPAPVVGTAPVFGPPLPRFAPLPASHFFTRAIPPVPAVPFSPIVRPVAVPAPAPVFAPAPITLAGAYPFSAHLLPAPIAKHPAWK